MEWKKTVCSNGSKLFVSKPLPHMEDTIEISLRYIETAPISDVFLRGKKHGLEMLYKMEKKETVHGLTYVSCEVKIEEPVFQYHFYIVSEGRIYYYNQKEFTDVLPDEIYDFKILADFKQPSWVKGAVFYEIFPDRFCNERDEISVKDGEYTFDGHKTQQVKEWEQEPTDYLNAHCLDFYGGDLHGIEKKIPYLKKLGVDGVYLTPIFRASTIHRYDCMDFFQVDEHLGGDQALEELSEALHQENMKIILDISINHTGIKHAWFKNAKKGMSVESYYYMEEDGNYGYYASAKTLPKLNYGSESLREIIYQGDESVLRKWIRKPYNIDGWRFDVAPTNGEYKTDHYASEIWKEIREVIKEEKEDAYILAEDWNDSCSYLQGDSWDGIMNFFGCGRPIREYVGQLDFRQARNLLLRACQSNVSAKAFSERVRSFYGKLPAVIGDTQFNMIDCHDISRLHNDEAISFQQVKCAIMLMYMLPGSVCVYYGDEIGIKGRLGSAEGCRYPMEWLDQVDTNSFYRVYETLNQLRHSSEVFVDGGFKILYEEGRTLLCVRYLENEIVYVGTNLEEDTVQVDIELESFGDHLSLPKEDVFGESLTIVETTEGRKLELSRKSCVCFWVTAVGA